MQCKNHPDRRAEHFCSGCRIPLCADCAEETKPGEYYCFQCAMLVSVSAVGTTIKGKREKVAEHKEKAKEKKKRTPFHYFVMVSSVMILVMWGVILFGGQTGSCRRDRSRQSTKSAPVHGGRCSSNDSLIMKEASIRLSSPSLFRSIFL